MHSLPMCGSNHFRVFDHFPNRPCVLAGMMLEGLRLDPSTPISCDHVCLMLEGFKFIHSIVEGLLFNLFNQDVLEECRVHHFPNQPCVLACMMLEELRLDPSTPMSCEHVCLMLEGFKFTHSIVEGLMFDTTQYDTMRYNTIQHNGLPSCFFPESTIQQYQRLSTLLHDKT